ncbi:hypothetical protein [Leptospira santarosai]|nr:hypothetical protein [Leptospira santarosai]
MARKKYKPFAGKIEFPKTKEIIRIFSFTLKPFLFFEFNRYEF